MAGKDMWLWCRRVRLFIARPLTVLLLVFVLEVGKKAEAVRTADWQKCETAGRFHSADVWGTGLDGPQLLKRECFLIQPKDINGSKIDRGCSPPSTFWLVFLRSTDGSVQLLADVFHIAAEGFHQVCFTLMELASYKVSIYLVTTSFADTLAGRRVPPDYFPYALVKEVTVNATVEDEIQHKAYLASLPPCTQEILSKSNNDGRWIEDLWYPNSCRVNRLTPREMLNCLDGKRLLISGDYQMWALFAELMNYLGKGDRCTYFSENRNDLTASASLRAYKARLQGPVPYLPGSEEIAVHTTEYGSGALATYYGTAVNGFGVGRVQSNAQSANGEQDSGRTLKVTYVSHSDSKEPLFRPWMIDYTRTGPLANAFAPFDYVLATSGLHDLALYDTADEYTANLEAEFVPSIRFVVQNMSAVTWAGLWSAQEGLKLPKHLPMSNNARGFNLEASARRVTTAWGVSWLGMKAMTAPRRDLCPDSSHYSWPVSIATLELWLGSLCPPPPEVEPDSERC